MVYNWKPGIPVIMPVSAQVAGETLERLEKQHGTITPKIVLDDSREETAPLHKCFEWDDGIAAEKYREVQAGHIIRSIVVVIKDNADVKEPQIIRAMVNVAMENPSTRKQILATALSELRAFQKKYAGFAELAKMFNAIDNFAGEQCDEKTSD